MDYGNYGGNYSTTSYGAQGGANGGGFIPGDSSQSPSGGRGQNNDTLRPVTIKQLNEAQALPSADDKFKIDNAEIGQLTFVGQIRSIVTQATNILYKLDDGTGTIEVRQWIDTDAAPQDTNTKLVDSSWARVYGRMKALNNRKFLTATAIQPIAEYNEVTYHLLEATAVHLYYTRGPPEGAAKSENANGAQDQHAGYGAMDTSGGPNMTGVSATARKVYNCLKTSLQSNEGLHVQDIAAKTGIDSADVMRAGEDLVELGMIYTTVDDNTWAILDM